MNRILSINYFKTLGVSNTLINRLVCPGPLQLYLITALSLLLSSAALYRASSASPGQQINMVDNDWLR